MSYNLVDISEYSLYEIGGDIILNYFKEMEDVNERMDKLRNDIMNIKCDYDNLVDIVEWYISSEMSGGGNLSESFHDFFNGLISDGIIDAKDIAERIRQYKSDIAERIKQFK